MLRSTSTRAAREITSPEPRAFTGPGAAGAATVEAAAPETRGARRGRAPRRLRRRAGARSSAERQPVLWRYADSGADAEAPGIAARAGDCDCHPLGSCIFG